MTSLTVRMLVPIILSVLLDQSSFMDPIHDPSLSTHDAPSPYRLPPQVSILGSLTCAWLPSLWTPSLPYLVSDLEPLSSFSGPTLMCEAAHLLWPTFGFRTGMSRKRWQAGEGEGREGAGKGKEEPCAASDPTETDQCVQPFSQSTDHSATFNSTLMVLRQLHESYPTASSPTTAAHLVPPLML